MRYGEGTPSILTKLHCEFLQMLKREEKNLDNEMVLVLFAGITCYLALLDEENVEAAIEIYTHHCRRMVQSAPDMPDEALH